MKTAKPYIIGVILIAAAAAVLFWAAKDSKSHDDKTAGANSSASMPPAADNKACRIFTADDARTLMGGGVKPGQDPVSTASPDLNVSTCTYSLSAASDHKSASLLARVPITDKGITSNNNEFGPLKPTTVQDVGGYGDHAYWDAEHGQLNILKNNNWYILSFGSAAPSSRSLQQTQQLADLLIDKM
jgi:hypothetical protein